MENIKINVLVDEKALDKRIGELADELYGIYGDEEVVFVCVLKGSVFFTCDLMKKYKGDARIEFLRVSSYEGTESTGKIVLKLPLKEENIKDKHVLIIEDIVDTGYTLEFLRDYVNGMNPKSVRECTLLNKQARRIVDIKPEFVGFDIEDLFVIGYGLDYDQKYRNLPYIGVVSNE